MIFIKRMDGGNMILLIKILCLITGVALSIYWATKDAEFDYKCSICGEVMFKYDMYEMEGYRNGFNDYFERVTLVTEIKRKNKNNYFCHKCAKEKEL